MQVPLYPTNYYFLNSLSGLINATLAAPLLLAAAKIGLGTVLVTPGLNTTYAALIEATFTGYAESPTIVWGTPINDVDSTPTSISPSHQFRATDGVAPNQIYNVFVTDGVAPTATGILASGSWSPPIPITSAGAGLAVVIDWNLGNTPGNLNATIIQ